MRVRAKARAVRMSAKKARLVADQVRGRTVPEALSLLGLSRKRASRPIEKVLRSAVANAEQKDSTVDADALRIAHIVIDGGPMLKRWRPAPHGRAVQVLHRTCHITVEVADAAG